MRDKHGFWQRFGWLEAQAGQLAPIYRNCVNQHAVGFAGVQANIVCDPMGHQVATVAGLSRIRMKSDPATRATQIRQSARIPREKLEIDRCINPFAPQSKNCSQGVDSNRNQTTTTNLYDVFSGNQAEQVQNGTVFCENRKKHVVRPNHRNGFLNSRCCDDGRALLDELDYDNSLRGVLRTPTEQIAELSESRENHRHGDSHPAIHKAHTSNLHIFPIRRFLTDLLLDGREHRNGR